MKKYFLTGLVITLPLALTLAIVVFLFNLLTEPFAGGFKAIFQRYHLFEHGFLLLSADQIQQLISQIFILIFLFAFTVGLGMLARWFFVNYLVTLSESLFTRIPIVSSIYNICKDIIKTLFGSETNSFRQVVLVKFPDEETSTIGFITKESIKGLSEAAEDSYVAVFVPTTPNPTSGFLVIQRSEDLVYLDMSIEEAFKYIISCGVIPASLKQLPLPLVKAKE